MLDTALSVIAPHHCYICHKTGYALCISCKYDIIHESLYENGPTRWIVGVRADALKLLIDSLKFARNKESARILGDILAETMPDLPEGTIIVPVPTIAPHIRERGYDHALLIARRFAKLRGLELKQCLVRANTTVQHKLSASERRVNAERAFEVRSVEEGRTYVVIDDIVTTGETLKYAVKSLRRAGAGKVYSFAVAKQTLD